MNETVKSEEETLFAADYKDLFEVLESWKLTSLFPILIENAVSIERLKFLTHEDINDMIPKIGLRAEFRYKLAIWKKSNLTNDVQNTVIQNKVDNWVNVDNDCSQSTISSVCRNSSDNIWCDKLNETEKGKAALEFYRKNDTLSQLHRQDVINIVVENLLSQERTVQPRQFEEVSEKIVEMFPNESKDYYYIRRKAKKNPGGKLYDKYNNTRQKRRRIDQSKSSISTDQPLAEESTADDDVIDKEVLTSLKYKMKNNNDLSFEDTSQIWEKTFPVRRREIKSIEDKFEILENWPSLKKPFGYKLIKQDFSILYPGKDNCIQEKWSDFQKYIPEYYRMNLKNARAREQLASLKQITQKDSLHYVTANLLNNVIVPTARFAVSDEKSKRKFTITDGEESFALHLTSMDNYKSKIEELKMKHFPCSEVIQPIIVVVGADIHTLQEFYVVFDETLFKLNSFLECLNVCFQTFQVLSINYPKACQGVWLFIQKHFFDIHTVDSPFDFSSSSVAALVHYFKFKKI